MKYNRREHFYASAEFLRIECKKSVLFLPAICWSIFAGALLFAPAIEDIPARVLVYGFVAAVCLWVSYEYIRQAFTEIAAASDFVSVSWMGRFKQVWKYDRIDRIERVHNRGVVWYCAYHGRKCIFKYTGSFQKAEEMYMLLQQKTGKST